MSIRSLADCNGDVPWVGPVLARTDTVTAQGTPTRIRSRRWEISLATSGDSHMARTVRWVVVRRDSESLFVAVLQLLRARSDPHDAGMEIPSWSQ